MTVKNVGLIAAMPEETRLLVRRLGASRKGNLAGFPVFRFESRETKGFLIESGVGMEQAAHATRTLVDAVLPELIINFGFGGAVLPGPAVGDIVVAGSLLAFDKICTSVQGTDSQVAEKIAETIRKVARRSFCVHCGTFVTAREIINKKMIAGLLPSTAIIPVLEMETAAVARVAQEKNVSFIALRAISDGADEEPAFSIMDFVDRGMQVRAHKVLLTLARRPWLIPQLVRLAQNSHVAAESLATAVMATLNHDPA